MLACGYSKLKTMRALDTRFSQSPRFAAGLLPRMAKFTQRHCRAVLPPSLFYEDPVCNGTIIWLDTKLVSEEALSIRLRAVPAWPEAVSQARPGHFYGFLAALARPGIP